MSMIDMHAHYLSPSVLREASAGSGPVGLAPDGRSFLFPSGPSRPVPPPLCDLADRLRWMDERAIERQILAPWMDITGDDLALDAAAAWCRTMNDSCAADIGDEPRFGALAALPVVDGEAAARELVRSVEQLGFCGGAIPTQIGGRDLDVAGLEPLWEVAGSLGALLFIHPFRVMGGDRLKVTSSATSAATPSRPPWPPSGSTSQGRSPGGRTCGYCSHMAAASLPTLAAGAAHASRHAPGFDRAVDHPDSILECFYYDTILHDPRALTMLMSAVEPGRIAAGTDYPFPMILDRPADHVREAADQAGLTEDTLRRILSGTAEELLNG